ncbi:MAG: transglycosylase domain-containing protein [Thioalkalivibrio sp.]|nr:transglycosylase domain-containing protein [Thioalkalivibrio sp.]
MRRVANLETLTAIACDEYVQLKRLSEGPSSVLRMVWIAVAVGATILLAVTGSYVHEVRKARSETPELIAAAVRSHGHQVALSQLGKYRERLLLQVQDPAFRRHNGVDLATPGAGMTTLTQSLVKQLYFPEGFKQGIAKIRQTLIAQYVLDDMVSKDQQLELFLNIAYFGHQDGRPVHGFADASRTYFEKNMEELTDDEYLSLVAMLINPNALKPGTVANRARVDRIDRYVSGAYTPVSLMDVEYRSTSSNRLFEEEVGGATGSHAG